MNGRSAGGLVLLLIGSMLLIGFLTGNLDRWLGYLFVPPGSEGVVNIGGGRSFNRGVQPKPPVAPASSTGSTGTLSAASTADRRIA